MEGKETQHLIAILTKYLSLQTIKLPFNSCLKIAAQTYFFLLYMLSVMLKGNTTVAICIDKVRTCFYACSVKMDLGNMMHLPECEAGVLDM